MWALSQRCLHPPFLTIPPIITFLMAPIFIRVDDKGRKLYQCPGLSPSVDCGNAIALSRIPAKTGNYVGLRYFIHVYV